MGQLRKLAKNQVGTCGMAEVQMKKREQKHRKAGNPLLGKLNTNKLSFCTTEIIFFDHLTYSLVQRPTPDR